MTGRPTDKEKWQIDNALIYEVLKDIQMKASSTEKHVKELDRRFDAVERSLNSLRVDIVAL